MKTLEWKNKITEISKLKNVPKNKTEKKERTSDLEDRICKLATMNNRKNIN
jgi:hypothetical protein